MLNQLQLPYKIQKQLGSLLLQTAQLSIKKLSIINSLPPTQYQISIPVRLKNDWHLKQSLHL